MSKADYEKLRKEWYKKLKDCGFDDIEQDDEKLKAWHSTRFMISNNKFLGNKRASHQQKADYYYHAYQFLQNHKFEKEIHKLIWEEHSNGMGVRVITKLLTKDGVYKIDRNEVWKIVKHYQAIMKKKLGVILADSTALGVVKKKTKP